jgi:hypothetical protein
LAASIIASPIGVVPDARRQKPRATWEHPHPPKAVPTRPEKQHAGKCADSKRTAAVDHAGIDGKQRWETCGRREKEAEKGPGILQTEDVGASASVQVVAGGV